MKRWEVALAIALSVAFVVGTLLGWLPLDMTEVFGFVTGGVCVWLTVRQQILNWPIGLASNAFYIVLFFEARLFADMTLQVIYIVLGVLGWYWWLRGGEQHSRLLVSRASPVTLAILAALVAVATASLTVFLRSVGDAAPFFDALTTVLSLAAQYLLTRKLIENWYAWITADIIYIWLYASRGLPLTSGLYALFLVLCLLGLWEWRRSLVALTPVAVAAPPLPQPAIAGVSGEVDRVMP
jgi:nicotinamide mononucleotide transporter